MSTDPGQSPRTVDVGDIIDKGPVSGFQWQVVALCVLVALLDGFDVQAVAFAAPAIADEWGLESSSFGPTFAAALIGMAVGGFGFGPVADRWGRRPAILATTALVGLGALAGATAQSLVELNVYRFVTGVGLGGAVPNVIALTAEYVPARRRALIVTAMYTGFPLGATLGGLVCAPLIEVLGWHIVFILGGVLPLALVPVLAWRLPESVRFLASRHALQARLARIVAKMCPDAQSNRQVRYVTTEAPAATARRSPPALTLLRGGLVRTTMALWTIFFCNLLVLYFMLNWLPILLRSEGLSLELAIIGSVTLNIGGVFGSLLLSHWCDRSDPRRVLAAAFAGGAAALLALGSISGSLALLLVVVFLGGATVVGAQLAGGAVAATMYPTTVRATGVAWALSVGRFGSIVGPLLGGWLLAAGWTPADLLSAAAVPLAFAAFAVFGLRRPKSAAVI